MNVEGQVYDIPYKITNGKVTEMEAITYYQEIIVSIETHPSNDGQFEIIVPRVLINPIINGQDDDFIILVNGEEWEYEEVSTSSCFRTISFELPAGSEEIDIIHSIAGNLTPDQFLRPPPSIHVATDKNNYELGETITVSGSTCYVLDKGVNIEILNPEGEVYKTVSASPNINDQFSTSLIVEGVNAFNGTYTARATYAGESATSTFVVPEFPVSMIIFTSAVSLIFITRLTPASRHLKMIHTPHRQIPK